MLLEVPVMPGSPVSVPVMLRMPAVFKVTVNWCTPWSPGRNW